MEHISWKIVQINYFFTGQKRNFKPKIFVMASAFQTVQRMHFFYIFRRVILKAGCTLHSPFDPYKYQLQKLHHSMATGEMFRITGPIYLIHLRNYSPCKAAGNGDAHDEDWG